MNTELTPYGKLIIQYCEDAGIDYDELSIILGYPEQVLKDFETGVCKLPRNYWEDTILKSIGLGLTPKEKGDLYDAIEDTIELQRMKK